jgi:hypothetical protein
MQSVCMLFLIHNRHDLAGGINGLGCMVEQKTDTCAFDLAYRSMSQVTPIGHFTTQVIWQATDAVIGKGISYDDRHINCGIYLPGPQGCADARVATANDQ